MRFGYNQERKSTIFRSPKFISLSASNVRPSATPFRADFSLILFEPWTQQTSKMASLVYSLSVTFCFARIFCGFYAVCDQFIVSIVKVYAHLYLESHRLKLGSNACGVGKPAYQRNRVFHRARRSRDPRPLSKRVEVEVL